MRRETGVLEVHDLHLWTITSGIFALSAHVVVGWDSTFGNRRRGTPDLLRAAGAEHGFGVTVLEPVRGTNATVYSSTQIRELLRAGKPREAATPTSASAPAAADRKGAR